MHTLPTFALLLFSLLLHLARSASITQTWNLTWLHTSPSGLSHRPLISVNGAWPPPILVVALGDTLHIRVVNSLGNESTSIHWHGQHQVGTPQMDGASGATQCGIPPGGEFEYVFEAGPAGSYWWHSHNKGQYPDGLRGPLVVRDTERERLWGVEGEMAVTVADWYDEEMPGLLHAYLTGETEGREPVPNASLINEARTARFEVESGKTYLVRVISMSALAAHFLRIEDHDVTVVAIDGIPVEPAQTTSIRLSAGQRYDVLLHTKSNPTRNYALISRMDRLELQSRGQQPPPDATELYTNHGIVSYSAEFPDPSPLSPNETNFRPLNDMDLVPADGEELLGPVDEHITLTTSFTNRAGVGPRFSLCPHPYVSPLVPSLYTLYTLRALSTNPAVYGPAVCPFVVPHNAVVQIAVLNADDGPHPLHLHGHHFQVAGRGAGEWDGDEEALSKVPIRRDTVNVAPRGWVVVRFRAGNPGVWLFHCHMEFHLQAGMQVTIVEAPEMIGQETPLYADSEIQNCHALGLEAAGNCAGNVEDPLESSDCRRELTERDFWG
ncbi:Cupredoxin [Lineolata rhizophorae]|uniref:Cupredoxin n=1 Tax=Lineolata rhizophorae TaxID=578093 RepID=A0A6A6NVJ1_9PEZI|nr:Cupredoxin [Lineolata rhizophorae]